MKKGKNFFYRVNPEAVLSELTSIPHEQWLGWLMDFLHDLRTDDPERARSELAISIIQEAHTFRDKRSIAGKASAEQRATKDEHKATYVQHMLNNAQPVAVTVAETKSKAIADSGEPAPKRKLKREPSGDQQKFIAWWCMAFEKLEEQKYMFQAKDAKQVSEFLKTFKLKDLMSKAVAFLVSDDPFYQGKKDICFLSSQINKIKPNGLDLEYLREIGIIKPVGVEFEDWKFWEDNNEQNATI